MRIIDPAVPRAVLDAAIRAAGYAGHTPSRWALPLLDLVEARATGWMLVDLDEAEFGAVWLPEHAGEPCHGDTMRLGDSAGGTTLADAAAWLAAHAEGYGSANPSCWHRIGHASREPASAIVVSPFPVGDRLKPAHADLVVVDGLHRALGYWLSGRRACQAYLPVAG